MKKINTSLIKYIKKYNLDDLIDYYDYEKKNSFFTNGVVVRDLDVIPPAK